MNLFLSLFAVPFHNVDSSFYFSGAVLGGQEHEKIQFTASYISVG